MKKILFSLFICIALLSTSANIFAQESTPLKPYDGAKHTYTFEGLTTPGAKYDFYVSTSPQGIGQVQKITAFGTMEGATDGVVSNTVAGGKAEVAITWSPTASTDFPTGVYLFLRVYTDPTVVGECTPENYKAVQVVPVKNAFNAIVADASVSGVDKSCPELKFDQAFQPVLADENGDAVDVTGDGNGDAYNAGFTRLAYTVTRAGTTNAWDFNFTIDGGVGVNYTYKVEGANSGEIATGNQAAATKDANVLATDDSVTITIDVPNVAGTSPVLALTLNSAKDSATLAADSKASDNSGTHTINLLPVIGTFSGK